MIKVSPLTDKTAEQFKTLFEKYYKELGRDDDCGRLLKEYVLPDCLAGLISVETVEDGGEIAGFAVYRIDGTENERNFKKGFGNVREIYVSPKNRRKGLGTLLLYTAEMKLQERGAEKCYCLPQKEAELFFTACGYKKTDGCNRGLDCPVYEKQNLNNCDCARPRHLERSEE